MGKVERLTAVCVFRLVRRGFIGFADAAEGRLKGFSDGLCFCIWLCLDIELMRVFSYSRAGGNPALDVHK